MNKKILNGILYSAAGSFWWGIITVFYFKQISFVGPIELVIHRTFWTAIVLAITFTFYSRWNSFFRIFKNKKKNIFTFNNWLANFYQLANMDICLGYKPFS